MMNEQTNIDANLLPPWAGPAILLVDLDAFFASVEQLDHPGWRGKPVIVGGHAEARGVVATCSYEARAYGVRSAMPAKTARELCPDAIWSHGNFARYREVSHTIMDIIHAETPHVQQVSIDEAFADISPTKTNTEHPVCIAARIQTRVAELGVTCSIGLGTTKSVAKIASEMDKPSGLTVVYPGSEASFLAPLPVRALSGIGAQAERALLKLGIRTLHDLVHADKTLLKPIFGKNTDMMCARAAGNDISPVEKPEGTKSVSHAITFAHDLTERADIEAALATLAVNVGRRMRAKHLMGTTLTIRIRYDNLAYKSHQIKLDIPTNDELFFTPYLYTMINELWRPGVRVRLLSVGLSQLEACDGEHNTQLELFEPDALHNVTTAACTKPTPLIADNEKRAHLLSATDALKDKFGEEAIRFGYELRNRGNTTGSSSKNPADYQ